MTQKDKKQLLIIWGFAILAWGSAIIALNIYMNTPAHAASMDQPSGFYTADDGCPDGSYNIGETKVDGEVICKLEPTGCPYGDSIPLDSPKCAPPSDPATAYAPYVPTESSNSTNTQPTTQKPTSTPKTTNNDAYSGGGSSTTYEIEPIADNVTPVESQSFEKADNAEKSQESVKNAEKSSNYTIPFIVASVAVIGAFGFAYYRYRHMV